MRMAAAAGVQGIGIVSMVATTDNLPGAGAVESAGSVVEWADRSWRSRRPKNDPSRAAAAPAEEASWGRGLAWSRRAPAPGFRNPMTTSCREIRCSRTSAAPLRQDLSACWLPAPATSPPRARMVPIRMSHGRADRNAMNATISMSPTAGTVAAGSNQTVQPSRIEKRPRPGGRGLYMPFSSRGQSYSPVTLVGAVTLFAGSLTLVMSNFIS
jgi:hypothetical protein